MKSISFIFFVLSAWLFSACRSNEPIVKHGFTQGTTWQITWFSESPTDIQPELDSIFTLVDTLFSVYNENSWNSQFNQSERGLQAPEIVRNLFNTSFNIFKETSGAFDVTAAPLFSLWKTEKDSVFIPSQKQIDSCLQLCGFKQIVLRNDSLVKLNKQASINFNAIAQGYTVDLVRDMMLKKGINSFLIEIGGEVYAYGKKKNSDAWTIGIEKPATNASDAQVIEEAVVLENAALATSGTYRKYGTANGKRYAHVIDPSTGRPVEHSTVSVTVIDTSCASADAYATAYLVMGGKKALKHQLIYNSRELYLIEKTAENQFVKKYSVGIKKQLR